MHRAPPWRPPRSIPDTLLPAPQGTAESGLGRFISASSVRLLPGLSTRYRAGVPGCPLSTRLTAQPRKRRLPGSEQPNSRQQLGCNRGGSGLDPKAKGSGARGAGHSPSHPRRPGRVAPRPGQTHARPPPVAARGGPAARGPATRSGPGQRGSSGRGARGRALPLGRGRRRAGPGQAGALTPCLACSSASLCFRRASSSSSAMARPSGSSSATTLPGISQPLGARGRPTAQAPAAPRHHQSSPERRRPPQPGRRERPDSAIAGGAAGRGRGWERGAERLGPPVAPRLVGGRRTACGRERMAV